MLAVPQRQLTAFHALSPATERLLPSPLLGRIPGLCPLYPAQLLESRGQPFLKVSSCFFQFCKTHLSTAPCIIRTKARWPLAALCSNISRVYYVGPTNPIPTSLSKKREIWGKNTWNLLIVKEDNPAETCVYRVSISLPYFCWHVCGISTMLQIDVHCSLVHCSCFILMSSSKSK